MSAVEHLDAPLPNKSQETGQNYQFIHFLLISYREIIFAKIKEEVFGERNNIKKIIQTNQQNND